MFSHSVGEARRGAHNWRADSILNRPLPVTFTQAVEAAETTRAAGAAPGAPQASRVARLPPLGSAASIEPIQPRAGPLTARQRHGSATAAPLQLIAPQSFTGPSWRSKRVRVDLLPVSLAPGLGRGRHRGLGSSGRQIG